MMKRSGRQVPSPRVYLPILLVLLLTIPIAARMQEPVDLDAIHRIKDEGFNRSQVMDIMSYLPDVHGPRLTGSPNIREAAEYAESKLIEWELVNVGLEKWGPFGRGWTNDRFSAHMTTGGHAYPIIGYPKAWTPGTDGGVSGEAVIADIGSPADFDEYRGQLRGKYVLISPMPEVPALFDPLAVRLTDEALAQRAMQPQARGGRGRRGRGGRGGADFRQERMQFFMDEGVVALLEPGRGSGGTVFVGGGGSRDPEADPVPAQIVLAVEHYGRMYRTLQRDVPVTVEMDVANTFYDDDLDAFNVIGEIRGTDKADEVVMLGAHFDSWHSGTGATDNAAGSAVMMEAVRILKETGLRMRRTVRIGLWTGEEQGLLGSRAYVGDHFGDRQTMQLKSEHEKFSGYFNVDNGTGAVRGVYLQGNEAIAPVFEAWMKPFENLGMTTLAIRNTGGTDHLSFDAVGLPGFQFIQDPVEYGSRTHHSSMDVYERIQPMDMMKNAVIVASFVYHTANREELLPRKPLPRPQGRGGRGRGRGRGQ